MIVRRGDVILANLEPVAGSEQGRIRPCIVVQNDIANRFSPTTIIIPLTSNIPVKDYPEEPILSSIETGLKQTSAALCNQIRTISIEERVLKKLSVINVEAMRKIETAIRVSLAIE